MTTSPYHYNMQDYPWWLFTQIGLHIEHGKADAAHADLDKMLDRMDQEHGPGLAARKMRCSALLSHCLRGSYRGGAPSEPILVGYMQTLDELAPKRSWSAIRKVMHRYVDNLVGQIRISHTCDVDRLIDDIRRQMRESTQELETLARYANNAGIHPDYLSRRYKQVVGQTFRQERHFFRMQHACHLLQQTKMKLSAIAERIGIHDTSRFIRQFKLQTGQTPTEYRSYQMSRNARDAESQLSITASGV